jgi:hypothetical protein
MQYEGVTRETMLATLSKNDLPAKKKPKQRSPDYEAMILFAKSKQCRLLLRKRCVSDLYFRGAKGDDDKFTA